MGKSSKAKAKAKVKAREKEKGKEKARGQKPLPKSLDYACLLLKHCTIG